MICTDCLTLRPVESPPATAGDLRAVSDVFPADDSAAIPLALLVGLLDSLATYRTEISELLERVERAGVDPLLAIDRLAGDPSVEPAHDLAGRRRQLEQLL
jgi:hypothetical protein